MANSHILVGASTNPLQPVVRRISTSDLYWRERIIGDRNHAVDTKVTYRSRA